MKKIALIYKIIDKCDFICETGNNFILILGGLADIHHEKQKLNMTFLKITQFLGPFMHAVFFDKNCFDVCRRVTNIVFIKIRPRESEIFFSKSHFFKIHF